MSPKNVEPSQVPNCILHLDSMGLHNQGTSELTAYAHAFSDHMNWGHATHGSLVFE